MDQLKYIFGPVPSRRLGRSLGINIVPSKICSLDCLYCEVGKTKALTMERKPYYKAEKILNEFKNNIHLFDNMFDVITITGAGEPTLNSQMDEILSGIKEITDKPVAVLTNTTTIHIKEIYDTLLKFDIVVPSLDGADTLSFNKINLPESSINLENIIKHLTLFSHEYKGRLYVEILFCKGVNDSVENIDKLREVLLNIKADKVQIGTIHRPPAYEEISGVDDEFLLNTAKYFRTYNIPAEVTSGFYSVFKASKSLELSDLIPSLLKMRPCTLLDMSGVFGRNEEEIQQVVNKLIHEKIIKENKYNQEIYYSTL